MQIFCGRSFTRVSSRVDKLTNSMLANSTESEFMAKFTNGISSDELGDFVGIILNRIAYLNQVDRRRIGDHPVCRRGVLRCPFRQGNMISNSLVFELRYAGNIRTIALIKRTGNIGVSIEVFLDNSSDGNVQEIQIYEVKYEVNRIYGVVTSQVKLDPQGNLSDDSHPTGVKALSLKFPVSWKKCVQDILDTDVNEKFNISNWQ